MFKSEPEAQRTLPDRDTLSVGFIEWLKANFGWLFANAQATTSIGTAFVYADGFLPSWAVLGEYDNGSASGNGRSEYIWLPTQDGNAIPVGLFRNGRFFAIHTDHLGTPRLMTNDVNKPVWQWPYSAFGTTKPTGMLKATEKPKNAMTNQPVMLKGTNPGQRLDLRHPGQMEDGERSAFQNWNREYNPKTGRYDQFDPIGLEGGPNGFLYADGNPVNQTDPTGLKAEPGDTSLYLPTHNCSCVNNCMAESTLPFTVVGAMCSRVAGKTPGPKPWTFTFARYAGQMCVNIEKEMGCKAACSDFCSGKDCQNPYPDK